MYNIYFAVVHDYFPIINIYLLFYSHKNTVKGYNNIRKLLFFFHDSCLCRYAPINLLILVDLFSKTVVQKLSLIP